jgi:hypothetical protein
LTHKWIRNYVFAPMYYLVYISTATIQFTEQQLKDLLVHCHRSNSQAGITGLLFYCNKKFIQLLEGEKQVVTELFEKIKQDARHRNVVKLLEGTIANRNFPKWSMGFKAMDKEAFKALSGYEDIDQLFNTRKVTDDSHPALMFLSLLYKKNYSDHEGMIT